MRAERPRPRPNAVEWTSTAKCTSLSPDTWKGASACLDALVTHLDGSEHEHDNEHDNETAVPMEGDVNVNRNERSLARFVTRCAEAAGALERTSSSETNGNGNANGNGGKKRKQDRASWDRLRRATAAMLWETEQTETAKVTAACYLFTALAGGTTAPRATASALAEALTRSQSHSTQSQSTQLQSTQSQSTQLQSTQSQSAHTATSTTWAPILREVATSVLYGLLRAAVDVDVDVDNNDKESDTDNNESDCNFDFGIDLHVVSTFVRSCLLSTSTSTTDIGEGGFRRSIVDDETSSLAGILVARAILPTQPTRTVADALGLAAILWKTPTRPIAAIADKATTVKTTHTESTCQSFPSLTDRIGVAADRGLWDAVDVTVASASASTYQSPHDQIDPDGCHENGDLATSTAIVYAVERLWLAERYRQADRLCSTHRNTLLRTGTVYASIYVEARYRHAVSTINTIVEKQKPTSLIEPQVERVEEAVHRISRSSGDDDDDNGDDIGEGNGTNSLNKSLNRVHDIRRHALLQLENNGDMAAARRLAELWDLPWLTTNRDVGETLRAQMEARRARYLQWTDVMVGSGCVVDPPELIDTPERLRRDFCRAFQEESSSSSSSTTLLSVPLVVGLDVEWGNRSTEQNGGRGGADLLQLSTASSFITEGCFAPASSSSSSLSPSHSSLTPSSAVLLVDIPALSRTREGTQALRDTVGCLLDGRMEQDSAGGGGAEPKSIVVVGFACREDLTRLRRSPCFQEDNHNDNNNNNDDDHGHDHDDDENRPRPSLHWLKGTSAVVDLTTIPEYLATSRGLGLSRVCHRYLGKALDKAEQCAAWGARPLTPEQRIYAALDAWACAALYHIMVWKHKHKHGDDDDDDHDTRTRIYGKAQEP